MPRKRDNVITKQALDLLRAIGGAHEYALGAPGEDSRPPGLQPLLERGYAVRLGMHKAVITPTGRAFLAGVDHASGRAS